MDTKPMHKDLWNVLTETERAEACLAVWQGQDLMSEGARKAILPELARCLRFREKFLQRKSAEERAILLLKNIKRPDLAGFYGPMLRSWLLCRKSPMLSTFLNALGLPHNNGLIQEDVQPPDMAGFRKGIQAIHGKFPDKDVAVYLSCLILLGQDLWDHLSEAIEAEQFDLAGLLGIAAPGKSEAGPKEQAEEEEETTAQPEDTDEFTTLDNWLIRTIVASAFGEEGALQPEQVEDLVEETVELNASKQHRLFHRGYLHAIFGRGLSFHFQGENEERRLWYFCGALFGFLRREDHAKCLSLLQEQARLAKRLAESRKVRCGAMLLPQLYRPLLDAGEFALARDWLENQVMMLHPEKRARMLFGAHCDAATLLRRGKPAEASLFLEVVDSATEDATAFPEGFCSWIRMQNDRKRAQALQLKGEFAGAEHILEELVKKEGFDDGPSALGDLGLIRGGFRSLQAILPRREQEKSAPLHDSLAKGAELFEQAVTRHGTMATNAHFCLGILHLLRDTKHASRCADHFKNALLGMLRKEEAYSEGNLIEWAQFCLGLTLLEAGEPSDYHNAAERIEQSLGGTVVFPLWLWGRALHAAVLFDDTSLAEKVAEHLLHTRGAEVQTILRQSGIATQSRGICRKYLDWLLTVKLPVAERWFELKQLLPCALKDGDLSQAEDILDALEGVALENEECRAGFLQLLQESANYSPAWDTSEAELARIKMQELGGQFAEAAELLKRRIYRLREGGADYQLAEARGILERVRGYKLDDPSLVLLAEQLAPTNETPASPGLTDKLRAGHSLFVLYIGGNETQEVYVPHIRAELLRVYPGLRIEFYFPQWTSRWNVHLDKVRPMIVDADVVVLNKFVRTQFGESVRRLCNADHPWWPCTGHGRKSLKTSIEEAAIWVLQKQRST